MVRGRCRYCSSPISWLYPCIELLTAAILTLAYYLLPTIYFPAYFIFISALIVTIRSDVETMLISRYVTLLLVPAGYACAAIGLLPITLQESIFGSLIGSLFLFCFARLFYYITGKEGLGQGDSDLMALIGAFLGPIACWLSLLIGSTVGSIFGIGYLLLTKQARSNMKVPFGPFLALGALVVLFLYDFLIDALLSLQL
jgi:leader peptidase (prepilin peptidase)/N-methyltransferase